MYNIHIIPSWIYKNGATTFIFQNDGWFVTNHERNIYYPHQENNVFQMLNSHNVKCIITHNKMQRAKMENF